MTATATSTSSLSTEINNFVTGFKNEIIIVESDVAGWVGQIEAGIQVVISDIQQGLGWLTTHLGVITATINSVTESVAAAEAAGVPVPSAVNGALTDISQAAAGVTAALNGTAIAANPSTALSTGYKTVTALQLAATVGVQLTSGLQALTAAAQAAAATANSASSSSTTSATTAASS